MPYDIETYLPYLECYQCSKEEKIDILNWVWRLTGSIADEAYNQHPVQLSIAQKKTSQSDQDSLDSKCHQFNNLSHKAANDDMVISNGGRDECK